MSLPFFQRVWRLSLLACAASLAASTAAHAVEGGISPYLKGSAGFMAGVMPPDPGFYATGIYYYYNASAGSEVRNGNVELGVDATIALAGLQGTAVMPFKFLGGQYAAGAVAAWGWADLDASVQGPLGNTTSLSASNDGFTDMYLTPIMLGWHTALIHWMAGLTIYAPTGEYDVQQLSLGKNYWAFLPNFSITYFNPKSGWDVSGVYTVAMPTNNGDTHYQSGDLFHLDWAVGKHFGNWEAGVQGNFMYQLTADDGPGAKLGANEARSVGIGPAVNYNGHFWENPVSFAAKWEPDVSASHTFDGDIVMVNATMAF